jgi:glutaredoxin 3
MFVEIYTKDDCSYCLAAKAFLGGKGIHFVEKKLHRDFSREQILEKFPSASTFPIIVLDGFFIGGYNQLKEHFDKQNSTQILLNEEG